jgi:Bacterial Ig-like domain/WD40-like Beta Propeller Repeat
MRRWIFIFLLLLALLIGLGGYLLWRTPRLRQVSPAPGAQRVSETAALHLRFTRRMQTASLATRLQINPPVEGQFTWEGNSLTFTPATPWQTGITVTVQLKAGAWASGFPPLRMPGGKSWSFATARPMLAYLWPADQPADIYLLDPASGEILRLSEGANVQDFSVSADGEDLYYSTLTQPGKADLFRLSWREAAGAESTSGEDSQKPAHAGKNTPTALPPGQTFATRLLACPDADCHTVQISPSGDFLAYERIPASAPGQPDYPQVYLLALPAGEPVLAGDANHETILPDWSPDGKLAFYDNTAQAFILLDPRSQARRTFPNQTGEPGGWTADGQAYVAPEITFVPSADSTEVPNSRLMRFDWSTSQVTDLTGAADLEDSLPAFSPDGKRLAFARRWLDPGRWTIGRQLYLSGSDAKGAHPLLNADLASLDSFSNYDFAWKPDSSQLAYVRSNQDYPLDPPELWLVDADGLNRVQLVVGGYAPQWVR